MKHCVVVQQILCAQSCPYTFLKPDLQSRAYVWFSFYIFSVRGRLYAHTQTWFPPTF